MSVRGGRDYLSRVAAGKGPLCLVRCPEAKKLQLFPILNHWKAGTVRKQPAAITVDVARGVPFDSTPEPCASKPNNDLMSESKHYPNLPEHSALSPPYALHPNNSL